MGPLRNLDCLRDSFSGNSFRGKCSKSSSSLSNRFSLSLFFRGPFFLVQLLRLQQTAGAETVGANFNGRLKQLNVNADRLRRMGQISFPFLPFSSFLFSFPFCLLLPWTQKNAKLFSHFFFYNFISNLRVEISRPSFVGYFFLPLQLCQPRFLFEPMFSVDIGAKSAFTTFGEQLNIHTFAPCKFNSLFIYFEQIKFHFGNLFILLAWKGREFSLSSSKRSWNKQTTRGTAK